MATYNITGLDRQRPYIAAHGNLSVAHAKYAVAAAFTTGESVNVLRLPNGAAIFEVLIIHSAFGATVTLDVGLEAVPNGATTKQGVDILIDGGDVSAAGILRRSEVGIYTEDDLTLDDDYYLELTLGVADPAAGTLEAIVFYENKGTA